MVIVRVDEAVRRAFTYTFHLSAHHLSRSARGQGFDPECCFLSQEIFLQASGEPQQ